MIINRHIRKTMWMIAFVVGLLSWPGGTTDPQSPLRGFTRVVYAQSAASSGAAAEEQSSTQVAQAVTPTPGATLSAPIGLISPTTTLTESVVGTVTPTATVTATVQVRRTPIATPQQLPGLRPTPTPQSAGTDAADEADAEAEAEPIAEPLEGTIISNRTSLTARFFVEGETVDLAGGMSTSYDLPRSTTVLNLYNCAASTPESNVDCYWDPYVLQRDGFFEIYQSRPAGAGTVARLMLRTADAPPANQVWVQNRSANVESIVFRGDVYELEPAAVEEFAVDPGLPVILYVRSCLAINGQTACEWSPKSLEAGVYYALTEVESAAGVADTAQITIDLRPVVGGTLPAGTDVGANSASTGTVTAGNNQTDATDTSPVQAQTGEVICRVLVPALNIRSGPGLQYQIIGKIFSSEADPGDVRIVGRNADSQWYVVDPVVMANGWVTASDSFINCSGSTAGLEVVAAPPLPVEPAPAPPLVATPQEGEAGTGDGNTAGETAAGGAAADSGEEADTGSGSAAGVPEGYAVLVVNNVFEHEIRFTIDQQYRRDPGPSEYDLQPGQSTSIVVFPGSLTFSVSSPWGGGLSGNTSIVVAPDSSRPLWIRFNAESAGAPASAWELAFE